MIRCIINLNWAISDEFAPNQRQNLSVRIDSLLVSHGVEFLVCLVLFPVGNKPVIQHP